jgi:hypothetical protein
MKFRPKMFLGSCAGEKPTRHGKRLTSAPSPTRLQAAYWSRGSTAKDKGEADVVPAAPELVRTRTYPLFDGTLFYANREGCHSFCRPCPPRYKQNSHLLSRIVHPVSHEPLADGNLWSSRRGVHLVQEVEPLLVENSQFRNEFAASVSVGCFLQLENYRFIGCERAVTLQ